MKKGDNKPKTKTQIPILLKYFTCLYFFLHGKNLKKRNTSDEE